MVLTLSGIVMLVRLVQWENALSPMLVTLSGIVTALNLDDLLNADSPICTVPSRTDTIATELSKSIKMLPAYETPFIISIRFEQSLNAYSPMLLILSGKVTFVRLLQYKNALAPILSS
jgi:hypothetical protein